VCGDGFGDVPWRRSHPDLARMYTCVSCCQELRDSADHVARGPEEGSQLTRTVFALGGEVWSCDGVDYWFREAVRRRR
jgi:hypothetical protein